MAENLNNVNMILIYIFLFLNIFTCAKIPREHTPVLIWKSSDFQTGKDIDYLTFDKIKSDLFEFYIGEVLRGKKPAIVIFLEQALSVEDFDWRDENGRNAFPFLTELTATSKLEYFREVEDPHATLTELTKKGYVWNYLKIGQKFDPQEGDLLLVEFRKIEDRRPETLKTHDKIMEEISQKLVNSGKSWICIYTARHSDSTDKKLSSWHADEEFTQTSKRALSIYHDEHTGFALLTRGSIELHLPTLKNSIFKPLDNYLRASATFFQKKINFVIWFLNYKLTFYLDKENSEWIIQEVKIVNDHGDKLDLIQHDETLNKCSPHAVEFKSGYEPRVKVKLSKYKFLKLPANESCLKPYRVEIMATLISFLVIFIAISWNTMLENYDFSIKSKIVRVPSHKILGFKFNTI